MALRGKPTKIEDVAERANVSIMSVSRALRGVEGVSEATRTKILKIARQMSYVPNSAARSLAVANSNLIGISLPTFAGEVFADVLNGMRRTFDTAGYSTVIDTTEYNPEAELNWIRRLLAWQPAAIILTGIHHHPETRRLLQAAPVPVLEIWDHTDDPIDINVGINHFAVGEALGRYAVSLGYRKPAYVGTPIGHDLRADARYTGVKRVFEDACGIDVMIAPTSFDNAFIVGSNGTEALLHDNPPDVIFYLNDLMAFGGLMKCQTRGLHVPADIGLIGFNGLAVLSVLPLTLTTIETPRRQMGVIGAQKLLAKMNGISTERSIELPVKLRPGQSTRAQ
ncbi:MAG: LacI family DNA-binding transcriptional regulator [Pseudomonadota bacterium]